MSPTMVLVVPEAGLADKIENHVYPGQGLVFSVSPVRRRRLKVGVERASA